MRAPGGTEAWLCDSSRDSGEGISREPERGTCLLWVCLFIWDLGVGGHWL